MTRFRLLFCVLLLAGVTARARVFWRWGASGRARAVLEAAGGSLAYEADVVLNGGDGRLCVYGFRGSFAQVKTALARAFDEDAFRGRHGSMVLARIAQQRAALTLLLIRTPTGAAAFAFEQPDGEKKHRPEHVAQIPPYPDAEPLFSAVDEEADCSFGLARTAAAPGDVSAFYRQRLRADGWRPVPVAAGATGNRPGMLMFQKARAVCTVYAARAKRSRTATHIAIVHKHLRTE